LENISSFVLATVALAGSPGPATLSLAAAGAAFGVRGGWRYLVGVASGMAVVIVLTVSGLTGVLLAIPGAAPVVGLMAATYIVYLAYRIATAPPLSAATRTGPRPSFAGGVVLAVLNPKAYAALAALFSGFTLLADQPLMEAWVKAAIILAITLVVHVGWLLAGSGLTRLFADPRSNRVINVGFAVLLVLSVVFVVTI
jgi:threonine/homoserine/homoserine lactone efflux protein